MDFLKEQAGEWTCQKTCVELTEASDLLKGDVLLLASSTWNTGSVEGQLNPHMWVLLLNKAKDIDLQGKKVACIGLGDHRYFYTAKAAEHLEYFVTSHHGEMLLPPFKVINEPYGQEESIRSWGKLLLDQLKNVASSHS